MPGFIVQKIEKKCPSDIVKAIRYYTVLFCLNDIYPSSKQVELLAFTAVKGTITSPTARREFIELFDSSSASLENIKCKLVKKGWLVKLDGKIKVNQLLVLDFSKDLVLQVKLLRNNDRIQSNPESRVREVEDRVVQESE